MNAVVTITMGKNYEFIASLTHDSIRAYAKKIGAEFVVLDKQLVSVSSPHYEKFQIYDLLNKYERIAFIDTDVVIRPDCPNLFDVVSPKKFGAFDEGAIMERKESMRQCCRDYGEEDAFKDWNGKYYNTGIMVISRIHKDIFEKPEKEVWNYYEQSYLNLKFLKLKTKMHDLDYKFNRMHALDKVTGEHRLKSYIVHYAGVLNNMDKIIPADLACWQSGRHLKFKRNILINVGANRVGDNICAEPTVRHIVENTKDANLAVVAVYPDVFQHLADKVGVYRFDEYDRDPEQPYLLINTSPSELDESKKYIECNYMNMVDYTSIVSIKKVLTDAEREIRLPVTAAGLAEAMEVAGCSLTDLVLVHPGKAWASKTLPSEFWNKVVKGLSETLAPMSLKVGVIGADLSLGRGTVDIDLPDNVIDFKNLLSLQGLFALLSKAKILVSNDSGPIHAAGAFENWIVMIPTCKHPDLLLPIRHGSKDWKTVSLYKKLIVPDFDIMNLSPDIETVQPGPEHLPEAEDVVKKVEEIVVREMRAADGACA